MTYAIYKAGTQKVVAAVSYTNTTTSAPVAAATYINTPVSAVAGVASKKGANSDNGTTVAGVAVGIHTIR